MPYSGIPEEKWPAMERCVEKVMKEHEGEDGFDKSNAIAICHDSIMGSADFEIVTDPSDINVVLGANYQPGELLRFRNAELAKVEVNSNRDEISSTNIDELVATLPLMPIDDEHLSDKVIGIFTAARRRSDACLTDGLIYARRFPDIADLIMTGRKKLSVEALAGSAVCSLCGEEFRGAATYCDHLKNRRATGAVRRLVGLKAVGGAAVRNPADKTAGFDPNHIYLVASHQEGAEDRRPEEPVEATETEGVDMTVEEIQKQLDEALAKVEATESELEAERQAKMAAEQQRDEEAANVQAAKTEADAVREELEALKASYVTLSEAHRRKVLAKVLSDEEFESQKDVIMAMSNEAVTLFASKGVPPAPGPTQMTVNLDPPGDSVKKLTL